MACCIALHYGFCKMFRANVKPVELFQITVMYRTEYNAPSRKAIDMIGSCAPYTEFTQGKASLFVQHISTQKQFKVLYRTHKSNIAFEFN